MEPSRTPEQVRESALENMRLQIHNKIIQYLILTNKIENKEGYRNEILEIVEMVLEGCIRTTRTVDWDATRSEAQSLITGEGFEVDAEK